MRNIPPLKTRFRQFMRQLPECVDLNLLRGPCQTDENADFMMFNGSVFLEEKALEVNDWRKVNAFIEAYSKRLPFDRSPMPFEATLDLFASKQDSRNAWRLYLKAVRNIEGLFRKANSQVGTEAASMHPRASTGLLVILNAKATSYHPVILDAAVGRLLRMQDDGRPRFENLHAAIIIHEAVSPEWGSSLAMASYLLSPCNHDWTAGAHCEYLLEQWRAYVVKEKHGRAGAILRDYSWPVSP